MEGQVAVLVLWDAQGNFFGASGRQLTISINSRVFGIVQKPNARAVPPDTGTLVDTLQVQDPSLGVLFLLMTLEEYQAAVLASRPLINRDGSVPKASSGPGADRPTAGNSEGDWYLGTDVGILYEFQTSAWVPILVGAGAATLQTVTENGNVTDKEIETAGIKQPVLSVDADYTATKNDYTILVDTSVVGGVVNISLPVDEEKSIWVIKFNAGPGPVKILPEGPGQIDNQPDYTINNLYDGAMVQSDGSNLWVIAKK